MNKETHPAEPKKVQVIVSYTGHDNYSESFPPEVPIGTIKRKAMHEFGIEQSAADKYALQFDGANIDDKTKLSDLGVREVKLVLVLKQPQEKGYGR